MNKEIENKISISFIGELEYSPTEEDFLVEHDEDYVRLCLKLSQQDKFDSNLKVWVRSKNHFAWLKNFTEQIGYPSWFEEKTARLVLAELWNVSLPEWLTDADVINFQLIEIKVVSQEKTSFEYRFLTQLFGAPFKPDVLNADNLSDVIKVLVGDESNALFDKYPFLPRCLETKCRQWSELSVDKWVEDICKYLPKHANQVWQWLSLWSGLHFYPEKYLEFVLTPEQIALVKKVQPEAVKNLPLASEATQQVLTQIELFFKDIEKQVNSNSEFIKVLGCTSGRFINEYQLITDILMNNRFTPTANDVQKVKDKFISCPGVSENQLNSLGYIIKPKFPDLLSQAKGQNVDNWLSWVVNEYSPYRNWQVHNSRYNKDLEETVSRFSDWYISEYASIQKDPDLSLVHCLSNIALNDLKNDFDIILLIDCLPLAFLDILDKTFRNIGLSRHNLNYRFAVLPTTTEYNKAVLLSGDWQKRTTNYDSLLKTRSLADWNGKKTVYHNNLKSLSDMKIPNEPCIAVLNFLDADETLHSDVESKNTTYEDELHRLFTRVAEVVKRLSQEWTGPKGNFNVYLITDHGACRILEEEKLSVDSEIVNKLFANEKYRYAAVPEDQLSKIPENLWELGYRFKQPFIPEKTTYFLPRGHCTVRNAKNFRGYMHGGVTPEEVIVPTALYKLIEVTWKTLSARFLNLEHIKETGRAKFYIQRLITLEIEIQNPNKAEVNILRASIISPKAEIKSFTAIKILAESTNSFKISCYFNKDALDGNNLEIEIIYEINGEQHVRNLSTETEFKSAVSTGFNLKDL